MAMLLDQNVKAKMIGEEIHFEFDKSEVIYEAGEEIRGIVKFNLSEASKIGGIYLKLKGLGEVNVLRKGNNNSEDEFSETFTKAITSKTQFLEDKLTLWKPDILTLDGNQELVAIPPGLHEYYWRYKLPTTLPSSIAGDIGYIKYYANVICDRLDKLDWEKQLQFYVIGRRDLPSMQEPFEDESLALVGDVEFVVKVRLPSREFTVGQKIPISTQILNASGAPDLEQWHIHMVQTNTLRADDHQTNVSQIVSKVVEPVFKAVESVTEAVERITKAIEPVAKPIERDNKAIKALTKAIKPITKVVEPITESIAPVSKATKLVSDTVDTIANPVKPVTLAVEPVTNSIEPFVEAIEPVTEADEPFTDAIEPFVEAIEPVTEAVEPVHDTIGSFAEAIEPVTEAVEAFTKDVEPITETNFNVIDFVVPQVATTGGAWENIQTNYKLEIYLQSVNEEALLFEIPIIIGSSQDKHSGCMPAMTSFGSVYDANMNLYEKKQDSQFSRAAIKCLSLPSGFHSSISSAASGNWKPCSGLQQPGRSRSLCKPFPSTNYSLRHFPGCENLTLEEQEENTSPPPKSNDSNKPLSTAYERESTEFAHFQIPEENPLDYSFKNSGVEAVAEMSLKDIVQYPCITEFEPIFVDCASKGTEQTHISKEEHALLGGTIAFNKPLQRIGVEEKRVMASTTTFYMPNSGKLVRDSERSVSAPTPFTRGIYRNKPFLQTDL